MNVTMKLSSSAFVGFFFAATPAFAQFSPAELIEATKLAVKHFEQENAEHLEGFTGYKAWKSTDSARVKIYVTHGESKMEFDYTCHKHDGKTECHAQ